MSKKWKDILQYALGAIIIIGFFAVLVIMLSAKTDSNDVLVAMVGILSALATGVANYFFGSSKGSSEKNDIIAGK